MKKFLRDDEHAREFSAALHQEGADIRSILQSVGLPERYDGMVNRLLHDEVAVFAIIARAEGFDRNTVRTWGKLLGVQTEKERIALAEKSLLEGDLNLTENARRHHASAKTLQKLAKKHQLRGRGRQEKASTGKQQVIISVADEHPEFSSAQIVAFLAERSVRVTGKWVNMVLADRRRAKLLAAQCDRFLEVAGKLAGRMASREQGFAVHDSLKKIAQLAPKLRPENNLEVVYKFSHLFRIDRLYFIGETLLATMDPLVMKGIEASLPADKQWLGFRENLEMVGQGRGIGSSFSRAARQARSLMEKIDSQLNATRPRDPALPAPQCKT